MTRALLIAALLLGGCAASHGLEGDAGASTDAGSAEVALDAGTPDAGPTDVEPAPTTGGVECGPNRCLVGEICCNASCGVCAFEDECVDHGCPGP